MTAVRLSSLLVYPMGICCNYVVKHSYNELGDGSENNYMRWISWLLIR